MNRTFTPSWNPPTPAGAANASPCMSKLEAIERRLEAIERCLWQVSFHVQTVAPSPTPVVPSPTVSDGVTPPWSPKP